jgi:hypothetical protein
MGFFKGTHPVDRNNCKETEFSIYSTSSIIRLVSRVFQTQGGPTTA